MHHHQNLPGGAAFPPSQPEHLRCSHCGDDGIVFTDAPASHALPCPGCAYGLRKSLTWIVSPSAAIQVTPAHYREVTWQNGVTLDHIAVCDAPADARRHPDGYRCRRPALPGTGGRTPLCDVHARGAEIAPPSGAAAEFVATARNRHAEWEANRDARHAADEVAS